ncbi:MAG TPA: aminodeoxychorismate synthase component I [Candidatus Kapabacteria bacterium]|nr:aminodeoxychorismate synthase component I [Candidatus Kapabacteria bacterium]
MIKSNYINLMNEYGRDNLPFLFVINYDNSEGIVLKLDEIQGTEILFSIDGDSNYSSDYEINQVLINKYPEEYEVYLEKFNKVLRELKYGNSYLTNLTCQTKISTEATLLDIFLASKAKYKLYFKNRYICFSPECFVNIDNGIISTYPMKGTISTNVHNALNVLMDDEKERAEHNTIVDLLRNDLSIVAENVKVTNFRYPSYIKTKDYELIQLSSEITGELSEDYREHIGDIFSQLLPAGSVTGAPKKKTLEIIKEVEDYNRNFYTGVFGIYKDGIIKSAVAIRFIESHNEELYFKSGGGITIHSNAQSEYQEMIDKIYVPIA